MCTKELNYSNILRLGELHGHPYTDIIFKRYGINNMFRDTVKMDNAYLIANDKEYEIIFTYIKENYYNDLQSQTILTYDGMNIYKLYTLD